MLTVEPGLYFQADDLTLPEELRGIGVRIEDDVVITEDGAATCPTPAPPPRRGRGLDGALRAIERLPLLDVQDLAVTFPTADGVVQAVRGVSFDVDRGQTLGIVGESGSGKSVATQTIIGLTAGARVSGTAFFDGRDLLTMPRRSCATSGAPRSR